ncbi:MAG TPA: PilN domain-containing protein [Bryobacteraceae bacterium]|nr:PilN domain-containing protein [Bryobacteraceae bacterium]
MGAELMAASGQDLRTLLAFGTGVGIEVRESSLEITVARVRPSGAQVIGRQTIRDFRERPAAEWGAEYTAFLKSLGEGRLSATVLLPRSEVIVRQVALRGVASKDVESAIAFQLDSLHPYGEDEVVYGTSPLGGGTVLVGILRRTTLDGYAALFAEAGVAVNSFTFSAAAIHGAVRLFAPPPAAGFVAMSRVAEGGTVEVYGESPARALFSAEFDAPEERALVLGASELRLPPDAQPMALTDVLPKARARGNVKDWEPLPYAAALAGACPWLAPAANLLPAAMRHSNSRHMFIPTAVLGVLLLVTAVAAMAYNKVAERAYLRKVEAEIARLEPEARKAAALDRQIDLARNRARLLDEFRGRTRSDLDALDELTRLLPPPIWTSSIDLTRTSAVINGEADQAAGLLKVIDGSRLFADSSFTVISRTGSNELFRIQTTREGRR